METQMAAEDRIRRMKERTQQSAKTSKTLLADTSQSSSDDDNESKGWWRVVEDRDSSGRS